MDHLLIIIIQIIIKTIQVKTSSRVMAKDKTINKLKVIEYPQERGVIGVLRLM